MSAFPLVRFTTGPTPDAPVLFDCVDATRPGVETWVQREGFTIGVSELEGDPDAVAQQWGLRQAVVPLIIQGSKAAALERQSALARVLMGRRFWMMVQLDPSTAPVWWYCYQPQPREVSFDSVYVDDNDQIVTGDDPTAEPIPDLWEIQIQLTTKAFGYLERITMPSMVMGNDPTNTSPSAPPAYRVDLPPVPGDALTYARVSITPDDTEGGYSPWTVIAARGDDQDPVFDDIGILWQRDAGTTATTGEDPGCLGGSYTRLKMPGSNASSMPFQDRLTRTLNLAPGRYRALLRVSLPTVDVRTFQLGVTAGDPRAGNYPPRSPLTVTTIDASAFQSRMTGWVDLGDVYAGLANLPADVDVDTAETLIRLWIGSNLPDPDIRLDYFALVRIEGDLVDGDSLTSTFVTGGGFASTLDGDTGTFWREDAPTSGGSGKVIVSASAIDTFGGFPRLDPATSNRLYVFPMYGANGGAIADPTTGMDYPTSTRTIDVSVHPLVLWLGDGQPNPRLGGTP